MRPLALALAATAGLGLGLGACSGDGGGGGGPGGSCVTDADCGGDVCTRIHECDPADQVRSVMLRWTVQGQPASDTACTNAAIDHLEISYLDGTYGDDLTYAPVPCDVGQFLIDKFPTRYDSAEINAIASGGGQWGSASTSLVGDPVDDTLDLH